MKLYVKKREGFDLESKNLTLQLKEFFGLDSLLKIDVINEYIISNISKDTYDKSKEIIFSQPQIDDIFEELDLNDCDDYFIIRPLKGQFDQRADSAMQCLKMLSINDDPQVKCSKIYKIYGRISKNEKEKILNFLINPIESREVKLGCIDNEELSLNEENKEIEIIKDFIYLDDFTDIIKKYRLNLTQEDLKCIKDYFIKENKDPNLLELKIIDTYWSDHCRHTTFFTEFRNIKFEDERISNIYKDYIETKKEINNNKPVTLMDISTIMCAYLKAQNKLNSLIQGKENNACSIEVKIPTKQGDESWILFFKNETHNHPTEIEPFGGASTCIGGAIRDILSARGYVYSAIRISGCANPLENIEETMKGKRPQRKIAISSSDGYSSYGNQIGVATGLVEEFYHKGYKAKHLELGAVIGAAKKDNIISCEPKEGDIIFLIGGRTGRDGCGGAAGSSKSHNINSLNSCGSEVQKGNAPQERKLQRFFNNKEVTKIIKKCNDFGAGGVSVAVSELADSVDIFLDKILCKYDGMNVYDLALSESQERMAVLISKENEEVFKNFAKEENLECAKIAKVSSNRYIQMFFNGNIVAKISKDFLLTNGSKRYADAYVPIGLDFSKKKYDFYKAYENLAQDLNICSKRGLIEKFDSTIGSNTIFMPLGGKYQTTPIQAMAHKIPFAKDSSVCSVASFGFNPYICEKDPFKGAYLAVIESVCKLIAVGVKFENIYLSFQEYFEDLKNDPNKWGKPLSALLGAYLAQKRLNICAIGGKDSMSGSFEKLNVPPTFISFAFCSSDCKKLISPEFKNVGNNVYLIKPKLDDLGLPYDLEENFKFIYELINDETIVSAFTPVYGGIAEAIMKMCFGNKIGFEYYDVLNEDDLFSYSYGSFIIECNKELNAGIKIGKTISNYCINFKNNSIKLEELFNLYEKPLSSIYKIDVKNNQNKYEKLDFEINLHNKNKFNIIKKLKPRVLIPVFFGTNCEYDTKNAFEKAGANVKTIMILNNTKDDIKQSIKTIVKELKQSEILFLAGGFSGGDEPDGSAKMIKTFFNNEDIKNSIFSFLNNGLIGGICNGFQALIKLGLIPYGKIVSIKKDDPILLHNDIQRHQSKIVRIKVVSNLSPWLSKTKIGDIYSVPISHGEGKFYAQKEVIKKLAQKGLIATQYVDYNGNMSEDIKHNPNGSLYGIEGVISECGRIFGKMGHSERVGNYLYKNVIGNYEMKIFESAIEYFK